MQASDLKQYFLLREDITYLNFGAFGACPKPVFDVYQSYQRDLELDPMDFILKNGPVYLKESREALGKYINCHADDVVYVTNPSYAVNIIAKSLALKAGDEILTTNIEYGACDRTWKYYCEQKGAKYVQLPVRFPLESKEDFIQQFLGAVTHRTKLIFISHITSGTGLRLPVEEICAAAKEKGIMTFIDGAHAPGQIFLDLKKLDADIYTGACHKWMMTAKGSSFLYVKKEFQNLFDPLVVSWGYNAAMPSNSQFLDYHQMQGTRDFSAFLTIPAAIRFMEEHNWDSVRKECRALTQQNAARFCELLNATPLCPADSDFIQQLYSITVKTTNPEKLQKLLYEKYKIQIPVMSHGGGFMLRYSVQGFNTQGDLDILYNALEEIIKNDNLLSI